MLASCFERASHCARFHMLLSRSLTVGLDTRLSPSINLIVGSVFAHAHYCIPNYTIFACKSLADGSLSCVTFIDRRTHLVGIAFSPKDGYLLPHYDITLLLEGADTWRLHMDRLRWKWGSFVSDFSCNLWAWGLYVALPVQQCST